jgi:hypothetical protein
MKVKLSKDANKRRRASHFQKIIVRTSEDVTIGHTISGNHNYVEAS